MGEWIIAPSTSLSGSHRRIGSWLRCLPAFGFTLYDFLANTFLGFVKIWFAGWRWIRIRKNSSCIFSLNAPILMTLLLIQNTVYSNRKVASCPEQLFFFLADFDNSTWRSSDFCYDLFTRIMASWKNFFQFTNSRSRRLIRRCKMFEENFCGYFLAGKFSNRLWSWWYGGGRCCLRHQFFEIVMETCSIFWVVLV